MTDVLGTAFIDVRARTTGFGTQLRGETRAAMAGASQEVAAGTGAISSSTRRMERDAGAAVAGLGGKVRTSVGSSFGFAGERVRAFLPALSVAIPAAAVVAGAKLANMAGDFQSSMTSLVTGAGESESAIGKVSSGVLSMAGRVGVSAGKLASGLYMIESAGFHGASGLKVLEVAAQGARVGNADLATMADAVTTALNAYQRPASDATQVTNALVATVASGKTHMQDLAESLSTILPVAASLHVPLEQIGGAMATMTSQGIAAKNAATYLRFLMLSLVNPTAKAQDTMAGFGLQSSVVADTLTHQGLDAALSMITDAIGKKFPAGSAAYNQALASMVGGARGMQAALTLTGSHMTTFEGNVAGVTAKVKEGGDSVAGWSLVQKDFNQKLAEWGAGLQAVGIKIGTALLPAITAIMGGMSAVVGVVGSTIGFFEKHRSVTILLAAALGGLLVPKLIATAVWMGRVAAVNAGAALLSLKSSASGAASSMGKMGPYAAAAAVGITLVTMAWQKGKAAGEASLKAGKEWAAGIVGSFGAIDELNSNNTVGMMNTLTASADQLMRERPKDPMHWGDWAAKGYALNQQISAIGASSETLQGNVGHLMQVTGADYDTVVNTIKQLGPETAQALTKPWDQDEGAIAAVESRIASMTSTTKLSLPQLKALTASNTEEMTRLAGEIKKAGDATQKAFSGATNILDNFDPKKDTITSYYKRVITQSSTFADHIQQAIQKGLDPSMVEQMLEAGPEKAGPILDKMVAGHGDRMVALANQSEKALAKISSRLVEFSRLTTLAVQSNSDQLGKDLSNAMRIDSTVIAQGAKATVHNVAVALHMNEADVSRIGTEFGITFAQHVASGANVSIPLKVTTTVHGTSGTVFVGSGKMQANATGGLVVGPGTKTSDSVPLLASRGEYVVQASAVDHFGVGFFDRVNRMASGGLVGGSRGQRVFGPEVRQEVLSGLRMIIGAAFGPPGGGQESVGQARAAERIAEVRVPITHRRMLRAQAADTAAKQRLAHDKAEVDAYAKLVKSSQDRIRSLEKEGSAGRSALLAEQGRLRSLQAQEGAWQRAETAAADYQKRTASAASAAAADYGRATAAVKKASDAVRQAQKEQISGLTDAFRGSVTEGSDLPSLFNYQAGYGGASVASIEAQLRVKIAATRQFTGMLRQLAKKGLAPDLLQQLASAGPEVGISAARELLADPNAVVTINDLERQLQLAGSLGAAVVATSSVTHRDAHKATLAQQFLTALTGAVGGQQALMQIMGDLHINGPGDIQKLSHQLYLLSQQRERATGLAGV